MKVKRTFSFSIVTIYCEMEYVGRVELQQGFKSMAHQPQHSYSLAVKCGFIRWAGLDSRPQITFD